MCVDASDDTTIPIKTMWLGFVLTWLNALFAATGDARPLDVAELIIYNTGSAPPPQLAYATNETTLFVNFFGESEQRLRVGMVGVRATQRTKYPRSGEIELRIDPSERAVFTVAIRIPAWARGQVTWSDRYRFENPDVPASTVIVNGQTVRMTFDRGFARVLREWRAGDVLHIYFPMPEHQVVPAEPGCAAMQRGPLISCRGRRTRRGRNRRRRTRL